MGRPKGSKNFSHLNAEREPVKVTEDEKRSLAEIFTSIGKDILSIEDFQQSSGLSYEICARLVREIKAVSNILNISGHVHRIDYFIYLSRKLDVVNMKRGDEKTCQS